MQSTAGERTGHWLCGVLVGRACLWDIWQEGGTSEHLPKIQEGQVAQVSAVPVHTQNGAEEDQLQADGPDNKPTEAATDDVAWYKDSRVTYCCFDRAGGSNRKAA
jgi:hypothetical protein